MTRGSTRGRGQSWQLRIHQGTGPDGRKRWISKNVKGAKKEAEAALTALQGEVNADVHTGRANATVADLREHWHAVAAPGWSPSTADYNRVVVDKHLTPASGR